LVDFDEFTEFLEDMEDVLAYDKETFAKHPLLPNFCACPIKCEAYFSGVVKNFAFSSGA